MSTKKRLQIIAAANERNRRRDEAFARKQAKAKQPEQKKEGKK